VFGWWDLDIRELGEKRTRRRWEGLYGRGEENGEKGRNSDLKAGHVRPKNEYV
jgi:hypothetical protein